MMQNQILRVEALVAGYEPGLPIVNGVCFAAAAGEILVVLGPNGAGKSTLIKAVAGLVPIVSGTVTMGRRDITRFPAHQMVRHGLAFVPQTENVFASMSVAENLQLAAGILPRNERSDRMAALYAFFPDLARQRGLLAGRLSGGQRQMLAVARALVANPVVLMLDEPSAGLSPKLVDSVFARLCEIRDTGVAVILVEQNARAALAIADRALVLVEGCVRREALARELSADSEMAALYLGGLRLSEGAA